MRVAGRVRVPLVLIFKKWRLAFCSECLQRSGFGIPKAPRQTLSLALITLSLDLYSFDLGVNEPGPETGSLARPSDRPSARPSVRPSVRATVRSTVRSSDRPSVRPSVRPFDRPCVRSSDRASVHPPVGGPWVVRGSPWGSLGGPSVFVGIRGGRGWPVGGPWVARPVGSSLEARGWPVWVFKQRLMLKSLLNIQTQRIEKLNFNGGSGDIQKSMKLQIHYKSS